MPEVYVLDSSALIAYFNAESGAERVRELLRQAARNHSQLYMHHVHVGEVYYAFWRRAGETKAETVLADIRRFPIILKDRISLGLLREAGRLKASYKLSYADALAVGLARLQQARLVSCDRRELEPLEAMGEVTICLL